MFNQQTATYWEEWTAAVGEGWNRFWFTPASSKPLSMIRIAMGLLLIVYFLSNTSDLLRWYGSEGLLPPATVRTLTSGGNLPQFRYSLLNHVSKPSEVWIIHSIGILAAGCLAAGLFSRAAAAITLVVLLSYIHRVPMISGLGEPIFAAVLFYLCIAPSGEWFGVNAWLKQRKSPGEPQPTVLANLTLRMIQVHLAALVFMMGMSKLSQENWWIGDAVWYLLAQTRSRPVDLTFLRNTPFLINAWTHAIVAFEIAFPILIWNRFARPILLIIAVPLWLSIAAATGHLLFALAMISASIAFWPIGATETITAKRPALA
jgi:hypothetical protein